MVNVALHRAQSYQRLNRWRVRRNQRGASLMVVSLAMTTLVALGLFAARSAANNEMASGYDRVSEQTHFMMEHGALVAISEFSRAPDAYRTAYTKAVAGYNAATPCYANVPCLRMMYAQLSQNTQQAQTGGTKSPPVTLAKGGSGPPDLDPKNNIPGGLGIGAVSGEFYIEMSDFGPAGRPPAGSQVGGGQGDALGFFLVSVGAWGQVGPYTQYNGGNDCPANFQQAATTTAREAGRAYVLVGPLGK